MSDYEEDENKLSKDEIERFRQGESDDEHDYFENVETEELDDEDDTDTRDAEVPRPLKDMNAEEQAEGALLPNTLLGVEIERSEEVASEQLRAEVAAEVARVLPDEEKPRLTHASLGKYVAKRLGKNISYCKKTNNFMLYDEETCRWEMDEERHLIRSAIRTILDDLPSQLTVDRKEQDRIYDYIEQCSIPSSIAREMELSVTERLLSKYDANDLLIGVLNGVVDLNGITFRPGSSDDFITRSAGVMYDPLARCTLFEKFVYEIMDERSDEIDYLQKYFGYLLLGHNLKNVICIMVGKGANGKSVLANIIEKLLGQYCTAVPIATMIKVRNETVGDDIMSLVGCRTLISRELEKESTLNSAKLKQLTGNDSVSARNLRAKYQKVKIKGKFLIITNEIPRITDKSNGIWRRMHVLPFTRSFDDDEADIDLEDKLTAELPGIFNWAMEGLRRYQINGLAETKLMRKIKLDLREEVVPLEEFIATHYEVSTTERINTRTLYDHYRAWSATMATAPHFSEKAFSMELVNLGIEKYRSKISEFGLKPIGTNESVGFDEP